MAEARRQQALAQALEAISAAHAASTSPSRPAARPTASVEPTPSYAPHMTYSRRGLGLGFGPSAVRGASATRSNVAAAASVATAAVEDSAVAAAAPTTVRRTARAAADAPVEAAKTTTRKARPTTEAAAKPARTTATATRGASKSAVKSASKAVAKTGPATTAVAEPATKTARATAARSTATPSTTTPSTTARTGSVARPGRRAVAQAVPVAAPHRVRAYAAVAEEPEDAPWLANADQPWLSEAADEPWLAEAARRDRDFALLLDEAIDHEDAAVPGETPAAAAHRRGWRAWLASLDRLPPIRLPIGPAIPWRFGLPALAALVILMAAMGHGASSADAQGVRLPAQETYAVQQDSPLFAQSQTAPTQAAQPQSASLGVQEPATGFDFVDVGIKLAAVLGLAYGSLALLKRSGMGGASAAKSGTSAAGMKVVSSLALAPNRTVHVISVPGGKSLLLGATPTQVNLIADLGQVEVETADAAAGPSLLGSLSHKLGR